MIGIDFLFLFRHFSSLERVKKQSTSLIVGTENGNLFKYRLFIQKARHNTISNSTSNNNNGSTPSTPAKPPRRGTVATTTASPSVHSGKNPRYLYNTNSTTVHNDTSYNQFEVISRITISLKARQLALIYHKMRF